MLCTGPRAVGIPTNNQKGRGLGPCRLWEDIGQDQLCSPYRLVSQSAMLQERSVQVGRRIIWRRQYVGLVLGLSTGLMCIIFLEHCTLTNNAMETTRRALPKPPQRAQGPELCLPLPIVVGTHPLTFLQMGGAQYSRVDLKRYFDIIYNHVTNICVINNYDLSTLNGCWSLVSLWRFIYTHKPWEKWEGWALHLRLTTQVGWLYYPKSICNRLCNRTFVWRLYFS